MAKKTMPLPRKKYWRKTENKWKSSNNNNNNKYYPYTFVVGIATPAKCPTDRPTNHSSAVHCGIIISISQIFAHSCCCCDYCECLFYLAMLCGLGGNGAREGEPLLQINHLLFVIFSFSLTFQSFFLFDNQKIFCIRRSKVCRIWV